MRPDHTEKDKAYPVERQSVPITDRTVRGEDAGLSLICDDPDDISDDESRPGCPCCMVPWLG